MNTYNIALLSGDGVGPVMAGNIVGFLEILSKKHGFTCECKIHPFGKVTYEEQGEVLPDMTAAAVLDANAALVAAFDPKGIPSPMSAFSKKLGIYADVRTIHSRPGRWALRGDLDLVVIRELTQGFFSDRNLHAGNGEWMCNEETAFSLRVITYQASKNIANYAFQYAAKNGRKKITAAHKANVFKMSCGLFLKACQDVAKEYPEITYEEEVVDGIANHLISDPSRYDILLTTNLFGDILSDEAAALVSSLAPSVSEGLLAKVYMPVNRPPAYGAVKSDSYDPFPALLCLSMLLHNLGEQSAADSLDQAINVTLQQPACPTSKLLDILRGHFEN